MHSADRAPPRTGQIGLHEWFLRQQAATPAATALRIGARNFTYLQLHERALALAGELVATAEGRLHRVGLLAARSEQAYAGLLAACYTGAAVVPLNPEFPAERTRQMIACAGLDALIADAKGVTLLPGLADELGSAPVITEPVHQALDQPRAAAPGDIAYILFTSGSTGRPKGVPVLHQNVDAYLRFVHDRYAFARGDVFSQTFDLTFDLAMFDLFTAWGCGGTLVYVPPQAIAALPEFIAHYGITVWFSSPSVIWLARRRGLAPGTLPSLRLSLFCGEPLLRHDAIDWQTAAPRSQLDNLYGPTELTISCTAYSWDPAAGHDPCVNDIVPIGTMHAGLDYLLLGADGAPDPGTGELCVTGAQMFPGYLDPADDLGRFVDHDGRAVVPDRGSGPPAAHRRPGLSRPSRPSGEDPGRTSGAGGGGMGNASVPRRTRRGRRGAPPASSSRSTWATASRRAHSASSAPSFPAQQIPRLYHHLDEFPLNANRRPTGGR